MTVRGGMAVFFLIYGGLLPVLAGDFMMENFLATLAMMASCVVIATLLWSRRACLLNILIALYVFRVYLTRPYVCVFLPKLQRTQIDYVHSLNYFYNSSDAVVVYMSLLSLLLAWLIGLYVARPKRESAVSLPWIFYQVDQIVARRGWPFWLVWGLLLFLNFRPAAELWQSPVTGEGPGLFLWGLLSMDTITIVCLFAFLSHRRSGAGQAPLNLLVPALFSAVIGTVVGSRSAIYSIVILALSYWLFMNWNKRFGRRDVARIILFLLLVPVVIFSGLIAQSLRPLLMSGAADAQAVRGAFWANLNISDPNNIVLNNIYFGLTQLMLRLSSVDAQFLILNDRFIHDPRETFNLLQALMRTINDLLPGVLKPFPNVIGINRLFDYIYYDKFVNYNSENWGIQGVLYLFFGYWWSPVVVFIMACFASRRYKGLEFLFKTSPAFAAFFILLFNGFIEFGTIERSIPVNVVRPLASFLAIIILVNAFGVVLRMRQRVALPSESG